MGRQTIVRVEYDGLEFDEGFRTDLVVEQQVIVELKAVEIPASRRWNSRVFAFIRVSK